MVSFRSDNATHFTPPVTSIRWVLLHMFRYSVSPIPFSVWNSSRLTSHNPALQGPAHALTRNSAWALGSSMAVSSNHYLSLHEAHPDSRWYSNSVLSFTFTSLQHFDSKSWWHSRVENVKYRHTYAKHFKTSPQEKIKRQTAPSQHVTCFGVELCWFFQKHVCFFQLHRCGVIFANT